MRLASSGFFAEPVTAQESREAMVEIDGLIVLVESTIPANPVAPRNEKVAKSLQRELGKYFLNCERAFPYERLTMIYYRYVKQE